MKVTSLVQVRVISWIAFLGAYQAIREVTRTNTNKRLTEMHQNLQRRRSTEDGQSGSQN